MNSAKVAYTKVGGDESYTLPYGVRPILKYIPKNACVWCPFDKADSEFVKQISAQNKVIHSHIDEGQDFLKWEPNEHWDLIVSNPPFKNKKVFFERALSFEKPFALIMSNMWLNDGAVKDLFKNKDLELLMFKERMKFKVNGVVENKITFSSSYYCYKLLPKQIIMESLNG